MTKTDYDFPLSPTGEFSGIPVPPFADYYANYHIDFLRYLYYMCIMNADGEYPIDISAKQIEEAFNNRDNSKKCKPRISKILIGEAPSVSVGKYFYNAFPIIPWNATKGLPKGSGFTWIVEIKKALFPTTHHANKIEFLKACAKRGFLLIDLFPYAIDYDNIKKRKKTYKDACKSSFNGPYPINVIDTLENIKCCIKDEFSIGFGLIRFGDPILGDITSCSNFNNWLSINGKTLIPAGNIQALRPHIHGRRASKYIRVCGKAGAFGPVCVLLNDAGIV